MRLVRLAIILLAGWWLALSPTPSPSVAQEDPQSPEPTVYLLQNEQLKQLDIETGATRLVAKFPPLATIEAARPDQTERRSWMVDIDPAAQSLYQIEVWGRSSNRRMLGAPIGGELVQIDIATKERQIIFDGTTVFNFVLSPDGHRMIVFYSEAEYLYSQQRACILDLQTFQCMFIELEDISPTTVWIDNHTFVMRTADVNPVRLVDAVTGTYTTLAFPPKWHIYTAAPIPGSNSILVDTRPRELVDHVPPITFLTYDLDTGDVQTLPYTPIEGPYGTIDRLQLSSGGDYLLYRGSHVALVDFASGELIQEFLGVYTAGWLDDHMLLVHGSRHEGTWEIMRVDASTGEVTSLLKDDAAAGTLLLTGSGAFERVR